jgi:hypothetical protein
MPPGRELDRDGELVATLGDGRQLRLAPLTSLT